MAITSPVAFIYPKERQARQIVKRPSGYFDNNIIQTGFRTGMLSLPAEFRVN